MEIDKFVFGKDLDDLQMIMLRQNVDYNKYPAGLLGYVNYCINRLKTEKVDTVYWHYEDVE